MTLTHSDPSVVPGGSFLISEFPADHLLTPDDLGEDHRMIRQTAERFMLERVMPNVEKLEHKDYTLLRQLLKETADLGLLGAEIPEEYGGMECDLLTTMLITEEIGRLASFSVSFGSHAGIGTAPVRYFGTPEQKAHWLPKLAAADVLSCYALTESSSGSDALSVRTKAVLSEDGKHYILNGSKMWITNGGIADLAMVFAKVDGKHFSCFVVETNTPGFSASAEERKMGLHGSSTTALTLEDVKVPVENLIGEVGKGHKIALNVLNLGRFKLGAWCIAAARYALNDAIQYSKERSQFGRPICEFGAIQYKLGRMVMHTWVGDSVNYRTAGMIESSLATADKNDPIAALKAIEEYVAECSIIKVAGSEYLDFVADEAVQIFGGYGYSAEYAVERAYRDARINRIFEGTNEINRLTIVGTLLKRAMSGRLALLQPPTFATEYEGPLSAERDSLNKAKLAVLMSAGAAARTVGMDSPDEKHQEVMMAVSDLVMDIYAMDSAWVRCVKLAREKGLEKVSLQIDITRVFFSEALGRLWSRSRQLLANVISDPTSLGAALKQVDALLLQPPINTVEPLRRIAQRALEAGKYPA